MRFKDVDCTRTSYPNPAPKLTVNNSDKICMELTATTTSNDYEFTSARVDAFIRFAVHRTDPLTTQFSRSGEVYWNKDEVVQLPDGHRGFKLDVLFSDSGERRTFFKPGSYGPVQVIYDENSKALAIRGIIQ